MEILLHAILTASALAYIWAIIKTVSWISDRIAVAWRRWPKK
jgi:hypothetical protein